MKEYEKLLNKLFYEEKNYDGINALYIKAKQINKTISKDDVKEWLKKQSVTQQTHRKIIKKRFLPIYSEIPYSFQVDLTFFPKYKKQNDGVTILFTAININTRYAYVYYSKKKDLNTLLDFLKIFEKQGLINYISGDLEFKRKKLTDYLDENDIQYDFYKADSHKLGIINRFHRTIKEKLEKYFISNNTVRWIDIIDKIVYNYNHTFHNGIQIEPYKVNYLVENDIINEKKNITTNIKESEEVFNKDDKVRVKQNKEIFEKNKPLFSKDIYIITKTTKNSVIVRDKNNKEHKFKKSKLLKINEVEHDNDDNEIKASIKQNKQIQKMKKEDLIYEPKERRLRQNPRKKTFEDYFI